MPAKIKLKIDHSSLNDVVGKLQSLVENNIRSIVRNEAIPFLIDRIMVGFDSLSERADLLPEDPTNPGNWREVFELALRQDLERTFMVTGDVITVRLGDKEFLGYDPSGETNDPTDATPLKWMVYYLEGLAGDWAYISPETYEQINGGGSFNPNWGRFGEGGGGFMVSKKEYEEAGWDLVVPFSTVRHPFSGYSPLDIFTEALREFRFRPFIQRAIAAAAKGKKL